MTKDAIVDLCNHIRRRQVEYGPEEGFRFHSYFDGKNIVMADYGAQTEHKKAAARSEKQKKSRKRKEKGKDTNPRIEKGKGKGTGKIANTKPPRKDANTVMDSPSTTGETDPRPAIGIDISSPYGPSRNSATSSTFTPQIDPSLMEDQSTMHREGIDTQLTPATNSGALIDDSDMQILLQNGYSIQLPVNGPLEGPPQYYVEAAALALISHVKASRNKETILSTQDPISKQKEIARPKSKRLKEKLQDISRMQTRSQRSSRRRNK